MSGTFSEYLNDIISVEAELIGVLGVIGIQSSALRSPRFWFGSTRSRKRLHLLRPAPLQPAGKTQGLQFCLVYLS